MGKAEQRRGQAPSVASTSSPALEGLWVLRAKP